MTGLAIVGYVVVALFFILPVARAFGSGFSYHDPGDLAVSVMFAVMASQFWPLIALGYPFYRALRKSTEHVDLRKVR